jgi:hypothetical protein
MTTTTVFIYKVVSFTQKYIWTVITQNVLVLDKHFWNQSVEN